MPETTEVFHTKGIEFKIGSTAITNLYSTPDMGSDPEQVDVTSFDDETTKHYIPGLQDVQKLNFDFWNKKTNFNAAASAEPENGATATYTVTYPLSDAVNDGEKFRVSILVSSITRNLAT